MHNMNDFVSNQLLYYAHAVLSSILQGPN